MLGVVMIPDDENQIKASKEAAEKLNANGDIACCIMPCKKNEKNLRFMGYNIDKSVIMIEIGDCDLYEISERIVGQLKRHNMHVAFAESITGGLISKSITDIKGASEVFELGMVTYSNSVKEKILGVPSDIIDKFTAVSKQTAAQMALNALKISGADVAVAVTGYAGPGNFDGQPAGLSYAALADEKSNTVLMLSTGIENNRDRNRKITAFAALSLLEQHLKSNEE